MSGTFVVQSGSSMGATPAVAPKDGSSQSSDEAGGFASVLGQEDAASNASSSTGGAVLGKGLSAAHAPKFDPTRALFGPQVQPPEGDPKDAKAASKDGAGSTSDAPPPDPEAGDDRDRHALAAVLIPGFAAPVMPPPPKVVPTSAPRVDIGDSSVNARGAGTDRLRGGSSTEHSGAPPDGDDAASSSASSANPASSPPAALDAADGAAQAAGLASLEAPLPGPSVARSHPSATPSATASSAAAPDPSAALPVQAAPPAPAALPAAQVNAAAAPVAPRPAASAPRIPARDPATASRSTEQTSTAGAPSASSSTTAGAAGQVASPTHDPQPATAPRPANGPDAATPAGPAGRAVRQAARGSTSRAGDPLTGGADRTGRGRGAASGGADSGDPTSGQDAQATDPTAGPLQTPATATPGSVDDRGAKTMTTVTKASPAADASPAATSARLRDALASVSNHAVLRGPATGHIDVPDLGRIAVRAHTNNGAVDVDVTADHADTRALLRGHVNAMTADLHQADVPVARVTIERGTTAFGDSQGSAARDPGANRQDSPNDPQASLDQDDESTPGDAGTAKRVRIVL